MTDETDQSLIDALLEDVAQHPVAPIDAVLMARLVEDADRLVPRPEPVAGAIAATGWRGVLDLMGGWPAMGGLVAAGVVGLWIGLAPPDLVDDAVAGLLGGTVAVDLTGLGDSLGMEG
ncbi:hypothetical protein [Alexandriicola marinus]|uniref:hypothetical protein n=1 Tax=Alexandriicola marinus TaxID=2081710 RepID=UPI001EEE12C8|nr:hypothetical protein [Alexandriicola marinus]